MSRRAKKKEIIRPQVLTEHHKFEYSCPSCKKKVSQDFLLIKPARASSRTTMSYWCKNRNCEAKHGVTYRLFKKRNGQPKLKVFNFTNNGDEYTKRFKLLEPTTKGEKNE